MGASFRIYNAVLSPLLASPKRAWLFILFIVIAFAGSALLAVTRAVPLKLSPFDNKNELQLVIDTPKGTTLERTDEVAGRVGALPGRR